MNKKEILHHLKSADSTVLFAEADRVRKKFCGDEIHLRAIIEFSNYCKRDCLYCGIRKSNLKLQRYRMSSDEIFESVKKAVQMGYKTVVLQSGEDVHYSIEDLCALIRKIKVSFDIVITGAFGEKSAEEYKKLREAGVDRYLLKFETSDPILFKKLKPDSSYEERINCLKALRKLGYQVGSGSMVGLPGQTGEILAKDLLMMEEMEFDMIGIGPFIPHPDSPLAQSQKGNLDLVLKMVALARIITKNSHLPATTAIGTIDPSGRKKAIRCGANVMMPNLTPEKYKKLYEIYPNKICVNEKMEKCGECISTMVNSLGRTVSKGHGHSLKHRFEEVKL